MRGRANKALFALVAGIVLVACFLCSVAGPVRAAEEKESPPLKPFWTGPVYGVFTDAGPDSAMGPRAKIHVPIGVALTKPFSRWGYQFTPETAFRWTTKAYLGEDSQPLQDPSYNWMPYVRIVPETSGALQWIKIGVPDHLSNGDTNGASRSLNAGSIEVAYAFQVAGLDVDVYAKGWYVYDYGENTETIEEVINLVGDFGGRIIVRGHLDMIELATELGPEWQKLMLYLPLNDFYEFGLFGEFHHGKFEGLLDYGTDEATTSVGVAYRPN